MTLVTESDAFQYLWLKNVSGFDQRYHCYDCLKGKRSEIIPSQGGFKYPAGFAAAGIIGEAAEPAKTEGTTKKDARRGGPSKRSEPDGWLTILPMRNTYAFPSLLWLRHVESRRRDPFSR